MGGLLSFYLSIQLMNSLLQRQGNSPTADQYIIEKEDTGNKEPAADLEESSDIRR